MGNGQIWRNWENPVPVLQIYITIAHKSTHALLQFNGSTETIPCTTTQATKYFVRLQLSNIPHYLAEAYIRVTNNNLPWMKDLHSADLSIATTEPITSHNECLQV